MKKTMLSLLLVVMMILTAGAMADETVVVNDADMALDIAVALPEGYTLLQNQQNGHLYLDLISPEEHGMVYSVVIAHSEEYAEQTMIDMSEDEIAHIVNLISTDYAVPEVEQVKIGDHTLLCVFRETGSESNYACVVTVYHGYFITEHIHHTDYSMLTDADVQTAVDLLSGMQFSVRP